MKGITTKKWALKDKEGLKKALAGRLNAGDISATMFGVA
jgi:hypothetical protein